MTALAQKAATPAHLMQVEGLTKSFADGQSEVAVLRGVSFTLEAGDFVALLGPSGSGKSTMLSILGTLMRPSGGHLSILGEPVSEMSERGVSEFRNQNLGFVFQFHHLLPDFTALENVVFPQAAWTGHITPAQEDRAVMLLERVGLGHRIDFRASKLSGGQKQRVAIARALMNEPALILADEPTGNLDRQSSDQVMELLQEINREAGTAFLISTHDEEIARRCRHRIYMRDGVIVGAD